MNEIFDILVGLRPEFDFHKSEDFISDGMLDSFDIVSLITELEEAYNISIDVLDIVPENFSSAEAIATLIRKNGGMV